MSEEVVLFRHTFPKQPDTRTFSIILWARFSDDTYCVHTEFENGERHQGSYFSSPERALNHYNEKCAKVMRYYLSSHGWEAMLAELQVESDTMAKEDIKVLEILEHEDGSADLILEISDEFKEKFKAMFGLKRFSQKKFREFVIKALEAIND